MKILSISDTVIPTIYSPLVFEKFSDVDCVIGCGDLPYYYQEYIISSLNVPLFFVHGNHDSAVETSDHGECTYPHGGTNLHRRVFRYEGLLIAGVQGSIRYNNNGKYQYTQFQMWQSVLKLVPGLLWNRLFYGRYLDVFVTHAPPWGIHDGPDYPHIGIQAFRWLLKTFKPRFHLHGHIHVYRPDVIVETQFGATKVVNTYGYKVTELTAN
ncbi:MAG TPA: hypothetical protein DEH25_01010 [Chloroflexi bacterium]|nr:hypothetical protein [Chloroflexota bacterium]HBY09267.1 hypothetical protein [Chloroflexota bacterium]